MTAATGDGEDRPHDALQLEPDEHGHEDHHRVDAHGFWAMTRGWMMFMTTNQPPAMTTKVRHDRAAG